MRATAFTLLLLAACGSDDGPGATADAADTTCAELLPCETGFSCETADERCECPMHSSTTRCEPITCPATPVEEGTSCMQPGLVCDSDFEFPGYRCVAPENVWVGCAPGGTYDSRCPFEEPAVGDPCCWVEGFPLDPCPFGDVSYTCANDHWQTI